MLSLVQKATVINTERDGIEISIGREKWDNERNGVSSYL